MTGRKRASSRVNGTVSRAPPATMVIVRASPKSAGRTTFASRMKRK
jgi:hypothetical protein